MPTPAEIMDARNREQLEYGHAVDADASVEARLNALEDMLRRLTDIVTSHDKMLKTLVEVHVKTTTLLENSIGAIRELVVRR